MTRRKRRKFTPQFKTEAVQLTKLGDRPIEQVAKDLDPTDSALRRWVQQLDSSAQKPEKAPVVVTLAEKAELSARLNRSLSAQRRSIDAYIEVRASAQNASRRAQLRDQSSWLEATGVVVQRHHANIVLPSDAPRQELQEGSGYHLLDVDRIIFEDLLVVESHDAGFATLRATRSIETYWIIRT